MIMERTLRVDEKIRLPLLLVGGLLALSIPVAADVAPQYMKIPAYQTLNLTAINSSLPNGSLPFTFTPTLTPITLLHLELNETTPSGVRYMMAFSPIVIDISVSPVLLVLLAGLVGVAEGAWFFFGRGRNGN
jgi:hypothetical protein